jgi:hypothetical protein
MAADPSSDPHRLLAIGLGIGVALGAGIGHALGNVSAGLAFGLALATSLGSTIRFGVDSDGTRADESRPDDAG